MRTQGQEDLSPQRIVPTKLGDMFPWVGIAQGIFLSTKAQIQRLQIAESL